MDASVYITGIIVLGLVVVALLGKISLIVGERNKNNVKADVAVDAGGRFKGRASIEKFAKAPASVAGSKLRSRKSETAERKTQKK